MQNLHEFEAQREKLVARGSCWAGWIWVGTGETLAQWWEAATTKERNNYLRECGVQLAFRNLVGHKRKQRPEVDLAFPTLELVKKTLANPDSSPLFGLWGDAAPEAEEYPTTMMDPTLELDVLDAGGIELNLKGGQR